jgi:hypothetical protein
MWQTTEEVSGKLINQYDIELAAPDFLLHSVTVIPTASTLRYRSMKIRAKVPVRPLNRTNFIFPYCVKIETGPGGSFSQIGWRSCTTRNSAGVIPHHIENRSIVITRPVIVLIRSCTINAFWWQQQNTNKSHIWSLCKYGMSWNSCGVNSFKILHEILIDFCQLEWPERIPTGLGILRGRWISIQAYWGFASLRQTTDLRRSDVLPHVMMDG